MAEEDGNAERFIEDETLDGQDDDYAPSSFFDEAMYGLEMEELLSTVPESVFYENGTNDNPDLSKFAKHAQSTKPDKAAQDEEKAMMKRQIENMDAHVYRTHIRASYLAKKPEKPELVVDDNGVATVQTNANRDAREAQPEQQQEQQQEPQQELQPEPKQTPKRKAPILAPRIAGVRGPKKRDSARVAQPEQQEGQQPTLKWGPPMLPPRILNIRGPKKRDMKTKKT